MRWLMASHIRTIAGPQTCQTLFTQTAAAAPPPPHHIQREMDPEENA
jgi:hypothetical protein